MDPIKRSAAKSFEQLLRGGEVRRLVGRAWGSPAYAGYEPNAVQRPRNGYAKEKN